MSNLKPIQQKQIDFQDGKVTAVMVQDENGRENVYIPLRPLVEGMGLDWSSQRRRINRNPVLSEACISVAVTTTQTGRGSGSKKTLSIPISHLNGFLFGVNANRVKPEIRPLLVEYQAKCYEVLFHAFNGTQSMERFYSAIGHDGGWIEKRIKKHTASTDLGDIWLIAGVPIEKHDQLQDIINSGTFGMTVSEHKQLKRIGEDDSLPDNMTRIELLIAAIADETAVYLSEDENATGYAHSEDIAKRAGEMGKGTVELFESQTGGKVLSSKNHLDKKRPLLDEGK